MQAKIKRDALKARALAAVNTDRAERNYRRHERKRAECMSAGDVWGAVAALHRMLKADRAWLESRRVGLLVQSIWMTR